MDDTLRDMLICAHREKRLAAAHVDIQEWFEYGSENTFRECRKNAAFARAAGIPNVWIAYRLDTALSGAHTMDVFNRVGSQREKIRCGDLEVQGDPVIVKENDSAFYKGNETTPPDLAFKKYLLANNIDTILIDGVNASHCVGKTLIDGALLNRFNFIPLMNGINWPHRDGPGYLKWLFKNARDDERVERRIHTATLENVRRAIGLEIV